MSRKDDLEQNIRESYTLIREYEGIIRLSSDPREKARSEKVIQDQRRLVEGYFDEYRNSFGRAEAEKLARQVQGAAFSSKSPSDEPLDEIDTSPTNRVQIILSGDFSSLSEERRSAAIKAFALIMGIQTSSIRILRVFEGSVVFDLLVPSQAVDRLAYCLQSNDIQLHRLNVEKIFFERASGELEVWVLEEGKFIVLGSSPSPYAEKMPSVQFPSFLSEVGLWAVSQLKERWKLTRQEKGSQKSITIDLAKPQEEEKSQAQALLDQAVADYGIAQVERVLGLIQRKRNLIVEWKEIKVDNEEEYNVQRISRATLRLRQEELDQKIIQAMAGIETDLKELGIQVEKEKTE